MQILLLPSEITSAYKTVSHPGQDMAISVAVAIVQSRLDYCNSLLYDISTFYINKLQRVQNLAARLAFNDWHSSSHVFVSKLHWLPVLSRIKFKILSVLVSSTNMNGFYSRNLVSWGPLIRRPSNIIKYSISSIKLCVGHSGSSNAGSELMDFNAFHLPRLCRHILIVKTEVAHLLVFSLFPSAVLLLMNDNTTSMGRLRISSTDPGLSSSYHSGIPPHNTGSD